MAPRSVDLENVKLVPGNLTMSQDANMAIFHLAEWKLVTKMFNDGKTGISMIVVMKRKITSEMMTTYFPTLLLTAITFATTFFKPFFFEAALSVNLTTMLVMTTIFISKMEGLPPTSDIKMIDIWLVLCQMVPFAEVVLLTAMEYNRKDDDLEHREVTSLQMSTEENDEDDSGEKCYRRCWIPDLKTVGRCTVHLHLHRVLHCYLVLMASDTFTIILSEKKVLPSLVLASYIIYSVIALNFYFDY